MIRLGLLRRQAISSLQTAGCDTAVLDVDLLLAEVLGLNRLDILITPEQPVHDPQVADFTALLRRRQAHEPLSQILGRKDFWNATFTVSRDCLTPRPDSETLIEAALAVISDRQAALDILDMGTGSGCLLLSLLGELPHSRGMGCDISDKALVLARENAGQLGLAARCDFIRSDWADAIPPNRHFDIILCNPPYIALEEAPTLAPDVRNYEPAEALFAADQGYGAYRQLAQEIPGLMVKGGHAFLEIGAMQGPTVAAIFSGIGAQNIRILPDMAGRDRCLACYFP